jgi:hypothetical protein
VLFSNDGATGAVRSYVRPFLRGHRPLASMKSAMQVADQIIAL